MSMTDMTIEMTGCK